MDKKTFFNMNIWYKYKVQDAFIEERHYHIDEDTLELLREYYNAAFTDGVYVALRIEYEQEINYGSENV